MTVATPAEPVPLLEVTDLRTHFHTEEGVLRAVDGVSFQLARGRTLALVGESGCGKSVTAQSVLRLIHPPGRIVGGSVRLYGGPGEAPLEVLEERPNSRALYQLRGGRAALIFQEATAALSPVHTIGNQLLEAIRTHQKLSKREATRVAVDMLELVGIQDPQLCMRQYAHELSGGMRQRSVIAMALVSNPDLLIADEPTTALDVTIQAQVLRLLKSLQKELNLAILLITHDLGVVAQMADEVVVMYLGRVVERGPVRAILKKPRHPYTIGLLESLPSLTPIGKRLPSIRGSVPALSDIPAGCPFHPRCTYAVAGRCNVGLPPPLEHFAAPGGSVAGGSVAGGSVAGGNVTGGNVTGGNVTGGNVTRGSVTGGSGAGSGEERFVACWRTREVALERLMQRPAEVSPSEPPPAVQAAEDHSERVTQTAVPPLVAVNDAERLPESQTEAEWFDSSEVISDREGEEPQS